MSVTSQMSTFEHPACWSCVLLGDATWEGWKAGDGCHRPTAQLGAWAGADHGRKSGGGWVWMLRGMDLREVRSFDGWMPMVVVMSCEVVPVVGSRLHAKSSYENTAWSRVE